MWCMKTGNFLKIGVTVLFAGIVLPLAVLAAEIEDPSYKKCLEDAGTLDLVEYARRSAEPGTRIPTVAEICEGQKGKQNTSADIDALLKNDHPLNPEAAKAQEETFKGRRAGESSGKASGITIESVDGEDAEVIRANGTREPLNPGMALAEADR